MSYFLNIWKKVKRNEQANATKAAHNTNPRETLLTSSLYPHKIQFHSFFAGTKANRSLQPEQKNRREYNGTAMPATFTMQQLRVKSILFYIHLLQCEWTFIFFVCESDRRQIVSKTEPNVKWPAFKCAQWMRRIARRRRPQCTLHTHTHTLSCGVGQCIFLFSS